MNPLSFLAVAALVATMLVPRAARAATEQDTLEAQQVAHLLDYVGSDYGGAVVDGVVKSESELAEQIEVLAEAGRIAAKLHPPAGAHDPREGVERVKRLVEQHKPENEVVAAVKAARTELSAVFDLVEAPRDPPNRERGRQLYEQHCTTCHGADGRADTPRAAQLSPRPANFQSPDVARALSPLRVFTTARFGVPKTAMVPFDFLSDAERWDLAFYVSELDHAGPQAARRDARFLGLGELASESDDELRDDMRAAGIPESDADAALADLRLRAPYDATTIHPEGAARMVLRARAGLKRVGKLLVRGDRDGARSRLLNVYLEDVEPIEGSLRDADLTLTRDVEASFKEIRSDIDRGAPEPDVTRKLGSLVALLGQAGRAVEKNGGAASFSDVFVKSATLALREGVEAALLIAALLAVVTRSGAAERKRWVHLGWGSAVLAGTATWFAARRIVDMSGLGREMVEGITALLAAAVLFYVSYWLFAKREAARWMSYLRAKAGSGNSALPLFGISFLAVYREAFETILFYQPLVSDPTSRGAAATGALTGAAALIALVVAYGRAGRFAPPRSFFAFSSLLLYGLAVVFSGQGISALQTTGHLPLHPVRLPHVPALGVYPTIETYVVQSILVALALAAALVVRFQRTQPPGDKVAGSRVGTK